MNVFWQHHLKYQGNVNAIRNLDNCTYHDMKQLCLTTRLGIKLLPPKFSSQHRPADIGIITSLKVGYKALYLWNLFGIIDTPGGFERSEVARKNQRRVCIGIEYVGNTHLLDCMMILHQVWNGYDGKYVSDESACYFWRNA